MPGQEPTPSTMPTQTPVPSTMPNANQTPEAPANGTMPNANGTVTSGGAVAPNGTRSPANPSCVPGTGDGAPCLPPDCPPGDDAAHRQQLPGRRCRRINRNIHRSGTFARAKGD